MSIYSVANECINEESKRKNNASQIEKLTKERKEQIVNNAKMKIEEKIKKEFTEKLRTETKDVIEYQLSLDYYSDLAFFIDGESKKTAGKSGEITLRYPDVINSLTDDEREKEQDLALKTITFSKSWD